ncbi:putative MFS family arabinose efflux permease [Murinocardiopsis flavida]|uniref:Putative MFS family arabinose efflux permease n=1 Tax=Murinocardiopsis flavida TaxID=645275 RepID=A0A2P8DP18_9ACTN|nr:MFS transporter [Murinocardiopsis flavida]PSK98968.1 putative MFS family arabinose efflux permease [Murinocardiopsis flavida]
MLAVLLLPGALRAFVPALIGRSALAMGGLALLLAVHDSTGSYAHAGFATAAFGIANVVAAPWRARAVDRFGQRIALLTMASVQAAGFIALALAAAAEGVAVVWFLVLSAVVGLASPPLGAAMRTIWASLTTAGDQRTKAFSIDAVCEELLFVGGPVIITAVIAASSPGAGLWVTAVAVLLGTAAMTSSASSGALRGTRGVLARGDRPLRQPGFVRVLLALLGVGCVLGVAEIAAPAVAEQHGSVAAAGWLLAAFAGGSALGGLLYGQLNLRAGIGTRLFALCAGMGLAAVLVSRLDALVPVAAGLALVGFFLAPSLITGYLIADTIVAERSRTEASTWVNTAVNLGASLASAAAGAVIDGSGPGPALLLVGAVAVALAAAVPFTRLRTLERGTARTPSRPG